MSTVVGIIGGGQLARMMYQASIGLDLEVHLLAEGPDVAAARVVKHTMVGDYTDPDTVKAFAAHCDVITFDHEHVPTDILRELVSAGKAVRPGPDALENAQDKALMRSNLAGLPHPKWRICPTPGDLADFGAELGWPIIAKTSRGGYDGHGVWRLDGPDAVAIPFEHLAATSAGEPVAVLGEELIDFTRELSVIVARDVAGAIVSYPVTETVQRHGVCVATLTPAPGLDAAQMSEIQQLGGEIATRLGVVGLLAVELMELPTGGVVINELAMRPHNTGHWTIDGALTSQFENHLRAVAGLSLGSTALRAPQVAMHNVLGGASDLDAALRVCLAADAGLRIQLYGKEPRVGRKLGHVTTMGSDADDVSSRASWAAQVLMGTGDENG